MMDYGLILSLVEEELEEVDEDIQETDNDRLESRLKGYRQRLTYEYEELKSE